jgi:hypothetical protein
VHNERENEAENIKGAEGISFLLQAVKLSQEEKAPSDFETGKKKVNERKSC